MKPKPIARPQFEPVMARLKDVLKLDSYTKVAEILGFSSSAYANRKTSGSIPYEPLVAVAYSHDVNIHWLLFGEGDPRLLADRPSALSGEINGSLLTAVMVEMEKQWPVPATLPAAERPVAVGARAGIAALVYNKVAGIASETVLVASIRSLVRDFASVAKLAQAGSP